MEKSNKCSVYEAFEDHESLIPIIDKLYEIHKKRGTFFGKVIEEKVAMSSDKESGHIVEISFPNQFKGMKVFISYSAVQEVIDYLSLAMNDNPEFQRKVFPKAQLQVGQTVSFSPRIGLRGIYAKPAVESDFQYDELKERFKDFLEKKFKSPGESNCNHVLLVLKDLKEKAVTKEKFEQVIQNIENHLKQMSSKVKIAAAFELIDQISEKVFKDPSLVKEAIELPKPKVEVEDFF